ncbi:hypothetical protein [Stutzerimonas nitrititolerans]|uniref:hypothetical protein n=1 Tax=Stutzerimonas nitrititolerans TaxID=2482751 RepID=UPI00289E22E2|nr:hypothetical protein [Stutzerimonas nitrititolerans]
MNIQVVNDYLQVRERCTPDRDDTNLFFHTPLGYQVVLLSKNRQSITPEIAVARAHQLWDSDYRDVLFANLRIAQAFYDVVTEIGREKAAQALESKGLRVECLGSGSDTDDYYAGLGSFYFIQNDACFFEMPGGVIKIYVKTDGLSGILRADVPGLIRDLAVELLLDSYQSNPAKTHLQRYADERFAGDLGL